MFEEETRAGRRHPVSSNRQVGGDPHWGVSALCLGGGRRGRDVKTEERRGASVYTRVYTGAPVLILQPPPEEPRRCGVLPHALARIFCFVLSFRSINKCVIVNVKTHQSNNNGTKSKDYSSLLVTAE